MKWKGLPDVERVVLPKNPIRIGGFVVGDVYIGRIRFKGGKWKRVAIKRFNARFWQYPENIEIYQKKINDLARAGVRLPKMGFVQLPDGEWVLVSQLFGSVSKGSKIVNKSCISIPEMPNKLEALGEFLKVANAGYYPSDDLVEPFRNGKGIIPIDLDLVHKASNRNIASKIKVIIGALSNRTAEKNQSAKVRLALIDFALANASPELKPVLLKKFGRK